MFEIVNADNEVIALADEPRYVYRSPKTGVWIRCDEQNAECVAVNGARYSLRGRAQIDDAPAVSLRKIDVGEKIRANMLSAIEHAKTIEEFRALYTDLAAAMVDLIMWRYNAD